MLTPLAQKSRTFVAYGATPAQVDELLAYTAAVVPDAAVSLGDRVPLAAEAHVETWDGYVAEARDIGVFEVLQKRLVQLQFPIQADISQTEVYRGATRRGATVDPQLFPSGLCLCHPEQLELMIHPSLAGAIPVLVVGHRPDFVALVQALAYRNEPHSIPDTMGACMISGLNNWDRIRSYRHRWQQQWRHCHCADPSEQDWAAEFRQLLPQRDRYQDRLILVSQGAYSGVPASEMGVSEQEWHRLSLTIRIEHECTHYFTRRVLGSMRNNLLDELIADYCGIVAAIGHYRADWFLRFMGLPHSSPDNTRLDAAHTHNAVHTHNAAVGRFATYSGDPPLSEGACAVLGALVVAAAQTLETFDQRHFDQRHFDQRHFDQRHQHDRQHLHQQAWLIKTVMELGLDGLAAPSGIVQLEEKWMLLD